MTLGRLHHQSGIALGPILFLLAIIAIIGGVIAAGAGGFTGSTTTPSASTMAAVIIQESEQVQSAVQMLMANGCSETQLNFYEAFFAGTNNPNAPSNGSCNVFDPRGGAMLYVPPPISACFPGGTCKQTAADGNVIPGVGTGLPQAVWIAYNLTRAVCDQINAQLGQTTIVFSGAGGIGDDGYDGTFPLGYATLNSVYTGLTAACIVNVNTQYQGLFYRVLWTR
jgi:hypothetical protein